MIKSDSECSSPVTNFLGFTWNSSRRFFRYLWLFTGFPRILKVSWGFPRVFFYRRILHWHDWACQMNFFWNQRKIQIIQRIWLPPRLLKDSCGIPLEFFRDSLWNLGSDRSTLEDFKIFWWDSFRIFADWDPYGWRGIVTSFFFFRGILLGFSLIFFEMEGFSTSLVTHVK